MSTPTGRSDPQRGREGRSSTLAAADAQSIAGRGARGRVPLGLSRPGVARTIVVTLLVAVPALVLGLWAIDSLGVNSDEAVYAGQAASLARDPAFLPYFPVVRAHPLLFQSLLSLEYRMFGVSALGGPLLAVAFGLGFFSLSPGLRAPPDS